MEFVPFPKIARFNKDVVVTEKIDGTNAQIHIEVENAELWPDYSAQKMATITAAIRRDNKVIILRAGSRKRWITPEDDNFGFAAWVKNHADELYTLGPGHHFGEWWGQGIQRRYDLDDRRFSLFNVGRWYDDDTPHYLITEKKTKTPECCHVVPIIAIGDWTRVELAMSLLREEGSYAAPGFTHPEGVVAFHMGNSSLFKYTFDYVDGKHSS